MPGRPFDSTLGYKLTVSEVRMIPLHDNIPAERLPVVNYAIIGVCAVVFVHARPNQLRWFHPFVRVYDHVESESRARGLFAVQALPHLRGRDAETVRISLVDPHPNAEGHRLHAEALVAGLAELPPRCFAPASFRP